MLDKDEREKLRCEKGGEGKRAEEAVHVAPPMGLVDPGEAAADDVVRTPRSPSLDEPGQEEEKLRYFSDHGVPRC